MEKPFQADESDTQLEKLEEENARLAKGYHELSEVLQMIEGKLQLQNAEVVRLKEDIALKETQLAERDTVILKLMSALGEAKQADTPVPVAVTSSQEPEQPQSVQSAGVWSRDLTEPYIELSEENRLAQQTDEHYGALCAYTDTVMENGVYGWGIEIVEDDASALSVGVFEPLRDGIRWKVFCEDGGYCVPGMDLPAPLFSRPFRKGDRLLFRYDADKGTLRVWRDDELESYLLENVKAKRGGLSVFCAFSSYSQAVRIRDL